MPIISNSTIMPVVEEAVNKPLNPLALDLEGMASGMVFTLFSVFCSLITASNSLSSYCSETSLNSSKDVWPGCNETAAKPNLQPGGKSAEAVITLAVFSLFVTGMETVISVRFSFEENENDGSPSDTKSSLPVEVRTFMATLLSGATKTPDSTLILAVLNAIGASCEAVKTMLRVALAPGSSENAGGW